MEEEKKELKQESVAEEEKKVHKKSKKKFLLLIPVLIVLGTGLFLLLRETGVINKYVYEEVGNLAEREGVCFDNLLFSYMIIVNRGGQIEERRLCIMNNGDVYAFEWTNELTPWDVYYFGNEKISQDSSELHSRGFDDANWEKVENVVYLGRFSNGAVRRLNSYVENFDINGKYYYAEPPQDTVPQGGGGQKEREHMGEEGNEVEWSGYGAKLYWHRMSEGIFKDYLSSIELCHMNPTWWGGYEKEIRSRSLDENAIAAIKLFESSGFYARWVKMCLNGY
ncbi:MAG: hypothetical protein K2J95_09870 [Lachnospiraceae bacterium]|nr:hypothetical protein [Lachnospiraceae bacterium]